MNITEKIFIKSLTSDINLLMKSGYKKCKAPLFEIVYKNGKHIKYDTFKKCRDYGTFDNKFFKANSDMLTVEYGRFSHAPLDCEIFWIDPLRFNYNFRFCNK